MKEDSDTSTTSSDPIPSDLLIARYVAGECTVSESAAIERRFSANPEWRDALLTMRVDSQATHRHRYESTHSVQAQERLFSRLETQNSRSFARPNRYKRPRSAIYNGVTRIVALLILSIVTILSLNWPSRTGQMTSAVSTHTTGNGQRTTITLPDGSSVILSVASRLEVPVDFGRDNRTLRLDGEAFFTVAHHSGRPFTVIAGSSTTQVLGTSFVVRHYAMDTATTVAVRDGKVMVQASSHLSTNTLRQSRVLTASEQVVVNAYGVSVIQPTTPAQFSFTRGVLVFEGITLPEAIPQLNRWYDVDIRLGDPSFANQKIVGGFQAGSSTDLAALLQMTFNARIVREGRVLTLYRSKS